MQNGDVESFNTGSRDECLNEHLDTLAEAPADHCGLAGPLQAGTPHGSILISRWPANYQAIHHYHTNLGLLSLSLVWLAGADHMHRHGHRSRSVPKTEEGKRKTPDPISQLNQGFVFGESLFKTDTYLKPSRTCLGNAKRNRHRKSVTLFSSNLQAF